MKGGPPTLLKSGNRVRIPRKYFSPTRPFSSKLRAVTETSDCIRGFVVECKGEGGRGTSRSPKERRKGRSTPFRSLIKSRQGRDSPILGP